MAQLLSQVAVGSIVKLNESGSPVNYIVVNQGIPENSSLYDASCDGTWLLRKNIYSQAVWDAGNSSTLPGADIFTTMLNMLSLYDSDIQGAILQVKIPYCIGGGSSTIRSGANGLSCRIFPLGGYEVGFSKSVNTYFPVDGAKLSYFESGTGASALNKRIANYNSSATHWWLRSQNTFRDSRSWSVDSNGNYNGDDCTDLYGIRPCFIMDGATTAVLDDGTITLNQPPTAPGSITVPTVAAGQPCAITWTAATDTDGTIASYTLERSVNASGWTQVFSGNALTYTDTIGSDWGTIAYRVCAVDNYGVSGPYATSETQTVQGGILYISGPASAMGYKVAPFAFEITTGVSGSSSTVSDVAVEIHLDGNQVYSATVTTGQEISVTIDPRTIGGGSHTIEATASKTDYISAAETYTFSTPSLSLPDGGLGVQLQDDQGRAVFPQSIASLIGGLYGKSVSGNLQQLAKSVLFNRIATPKYQEVTVDLSTAQEGDVVQLPENGVLASFYVAKINYEQGLNGTGRVLLVRSSSPGNRAWDSGNVNAYSGSDIDTWLNGTYKAMFPEEIQTAMGTTEFYYTPGNGNYVVTTLERSVFLPSVSEMGQSLENANTEGSAISSTVVSRLGYIGFTRTPSTNRNDLVFANNSLLSNGWGEYFADYSQGSRPAFTLPSTFSYTIYVGSDGIHDAQEYTDGGTFSDYFGNDIPLPKIALSTYVGTGTNGSENPNSLTFDFPVKAVCIAPETFPSNSQKAGTSLWLRGCTSGYLIRAYANDPTGEILNITWTENGLQWYGDGSADQMNLAQSTYVVIAFG